MEMSRPKAGLWSARMKKNDNFDIVIVGAGAVGMAAALTFQREGYRTCLLGPSNITNDGRTVALFQGAICFLDAIGVWPELVGGSAPLESMRIIDDTGNLFHTPAVEFRAAELGTDAFGWNVSNQTLLSTLNDITLQNCSLTWIKDIATSCGFGDDATYLTTSSGDVLNASLVVAADGRRSVLREQAGISCQTWQYPQAALTTILTHERDHRNISTEFHTRHGPFTLVPMPGHRSSLVWLTTPERAEELSRMSNDDLGRNVERQAGYMLGAMSVDGPRAIVPMAGLSADRYIGKRLALVGETAHVFPPIGAQGLNLGLRDIVNLRDVLVSASGNNSDIGGGDTLQHYQRQRKLDVGLRTAAVDGLNRMLLAQYLPADWLRAAGLIIMASLPPLKRIVMKVGMRPYFQLPT